MGRSLRAALAIAVLCCMGLPAHADIATLFGWGASLPSSCAEPQLFFDTSAPTGQKIFACESGVFVRQSIATGVDAVGAAAITIGSEDVTRITMTTAMSTTGGVKFPETTVAALPSAPTDGDTVLVTDGLTAGDCTTGGGSVPPYMVWCRWTDGESAWLPVGDGTGAFDATAIDNVTWSDGANASNQWTFNVSGTDPVVTWGNGTVDFSTPITATSFTADDPGDDSRGFDTQDNTNDCANPAASHTSICSVGGVISYRINGGSTTPIDGSATEVRSMNWGAGSMSTDGTGCVAPAEQTPIATAGFNGYVVVCGDGGTVYGSPVVMPDSWDTGTAITFEINVQAVTGSVTLAGDFSIQCIGNDDTMASVSWSTADDADVTLTTTNDLYTTTTTPGITVSGCAVGDLLVWRYVIDDATNDSTDAEILAVKMEYTSNVGD